MLEAVDEYGNTTLHEAAGNGQLKAITALLDAGAELEAVNNNGLRPIDWAEHLNEYRAYEVLKAAE